MRIQRANLVVRVLALCMCAGLMACYVEASAGSNVECRNVVRRRADVETCVTRCNDDGCRTRCREHERWSREHRCWVE
jgi:hypothetical protein